MGINKTQLAKTLNVDEKEVRRILDPDRNIKPEIEKTIASSFR